MTTPGKMPERGGVSQEVLAGKASVSVTTLRNFERGATIPVANNLAAIQRGLEDAGVVFTNGDEPGVKLAKRKGRKGR
jgi:transcriptional regulator with XRE-family HTH domain